MNTTQRWLPAELLLALALAGAAACGAADDSLSAPLVHHEEPAEADAGTEVDAAPGAPLPLDLAKVKNILVGLPPTDEELVAIERDPGSLGTLIDGWMATPDYESKMLRFFQLAFQQTQISSIDLNAQFYPNFAAANRVIAPRMVQNVAESFARTALELVAQDRPFIETMTTQRFMMTPALMELYAFLDGWQVNNAGQPRDVFAETHPNVTIVAEAAQGPIPISETLDPSHPNYMHWYNPDVATTGAAHPGCAADPVVFPDRQVGFTLHLLLGGTLNRRSVLCPRIDGSANAAQLTATDFTTWKMVTIRPPRAGEKPTAFYDLPLLRTTGELVLETPRVGFFSTPAFFANWPTNASNQMRVIANQTLIVATGAAIDGTDNTLPPSEPGLDGVHAGNPACFACHKTMDPTRSILSSTYSWYYHRQSDPALVAQKGLFAFRGVVTPVNDVADLGATLAYHPLLASAWVQKLCYYANSAPCSSADPELQRIVDGFQASGFSWRHLIRDFFSSPMVTNANRTVAAGSSGPVVAVSRRDHLCATLDSRLGFDDACGLRPLSKPTTISRIAAGLPSDGYARGTVAPVLANEPTLFYRAGAEAICEAAATETIDAPAPPARLKQWSSAAPAAAIGDFVHLVMGLPPADARSAPALGVLQRHFDDALATGTTPADALKSTFVVACLSPSFIGIGL
ncbi:MAG: hypothetical protein JWP97_3214 [Labilithrix sp.]|nr:hypothetical protein [Labilithrix sp.]